MTENIESKLYGNGTIWITSVNGWRGKNKLTAKDLDKNPDEILDIFNLGSKNQLPKDIQNRINRPSNQITTLMRAIGAEPFFAGQSTWFVRDKDFLACMRGMEKIRDEHRATAVDVANNLEDIKAEMIAKYPVLADAKWPTEEQVLKKFRVTWNVCQIKGVEINETDPEELRQAKMNSNRVLTEAYNEYAGQYLEKAKTAMAEAVADICEKIKTGQKVTEATIRKPRKVVDEYLSIANIFDLDDLKAKIYELKEELENTEAKDIRSNWNLANNFANNIREMADSIGDLDGLSVDGSAKRRIKIDKAA